MRQEKDSKEIVLINQDLSQHQDLFPQTQGMIGPEDSLNMTDQGEMEKTTGIMIDHNQIPDLHKLLFLSVLDVTV